MAGFYKSVTAQINAAVEAATLNVRLPYRLWDGAAWPARGTDDEIMVFISSPDDTGVTAPSDGDLAVGDLFIAHPDSP